MIDDRLRAGATLTAFVTPAIADDRTPAIPVANITAACDEHTRGREIHFAAPRTPEQTVRVEVMAGFVCPTAA